MRKVKIGISGLGVLHTDESVPDIETKFAMIQESEVFDYMDRTPPNADLAKHLEASAKYGIPIYAGGFFYLVGRDEGLLEQNLRIGKACGSALHNVQIFTKDADGRMLTDDDVADVYSRTYDLALKIGIRPSFENHINMWSEHPGRVQTVAEKVVARGIEFNLTMDHSHVVMKMENPRELEVQHLQRDVDDRRIVLDPHMPGNVARTWIDSNFVVIAHARPAAPNNPINVWAKHPDGSYGRGVQYPWLRPEPGQWHSEWDGSRLNAWKTTMRDLLHHHANHAESRLLCITLEMIPPPDYGAGAKYSIFDNNVACARWIREEWKALVGASGVVSKAAGV